MLRKDKLYLKRLNIEKYIMFDFNKRQILEKIELLCEDFYKLFKFLNNEEFEIETEV